MSIFTRIKKAILRSIAIGEDLQINLKNVNLSKEAIDGYHVTVT